MEELWISADELGMVLWMQQHPDLVTKADRLLVMSAAKRLGVLDCRSEASIVLGPHTPLNPTAVVGFPHRIISLYETGRVKLVGGDTVSV